MQRDSDTINTDLIICKKRGKKNNRKTREKQKERKQRRTY